MWGVVVILRTGALYDDRWKVSEFNAMYEGASIDACLGIPYLLAIVSLLEHYACQKQAYLSGA